MSLSIDQQADVATSDDAFANLAKTDIDAFVEYVIKDEMTGKRLSQSEVHEAWHDLAEKHERLLVWAAIEHGKTVQMAVARTLFYLGRNPTHRVAIVSNTHEQAKKIIRVVSKYISESKELRKVFPHLQPGEPWTEKAITIKREVMSKDPSVQACGVHGNITGSRLELIVLDDMLDYENTKTPIARQDLWDWYHATLAGRLTAEGRVLCIGTAYHPDDLLHRFARQPGWRAFRYPVLEEGKPRWPERWPMERILKKREELGALEFARQMLCQARDDSEARFKREWIDKCLARGEGKDMTYGLNKVPAGYRTYTGVDLAVQQHSSADLTVLFTIAIHPKSQGETREVLNCEAGRWSGPEIVSRIIDAHRRYQSVVIVENNAAQDFILQFARGGSAVPMRPFTTGRNKAHPEFGVESIAAEMDAAKWIIPNRGGTMHPELDAWVNEMFYYDPKAHTGDRLMASWFAREGARMGALTVQRGRIDLMSR